jgi:hypothetical protein
MAMFEPGSTRRSLAGQLMWFFAWVGVTVVGLFLLTPDPSGHGTHTQLGLPPCPSAFLFDRPCPGCGLTTSFTATVQGQFGAAFRAHPFGPILYGVFTATAMMALVGWWRGHRLVTESKQFNWSLVALTVAFVAFSVARALTISEYAVAGDWPSPKSVQVELGQAR